MPKGTKTTTTTTIVKPALPKRKRVRAKSAPAIKGSGSYALAAGKLAALIGKQNISKGSFERTGARIGGAMGRGLSNITGFGDYALNSIVQMGGVPQKHEGPKRFSNCEYMGDVVSPGSAFNVKEYAVNPVNPTMFPWMSRIASLFTKYRFTQLVFEFRSTSSEYATSTAMGSIVMAPQYNVDLNTFSNKQQMECATHAVSAKPSVTTFMGWECARSDNNVTWYNVRPNEGTATNFTDPGVFSFATSGLTAASNTALGELWVHYTVELIEPLLNSLVDVTGVGTGLNTGNTTVGRVADYFCGLVDGSVTKNTQTNLTANYGFATTVSGVVETNMLTLSQTTTDLGFWITLPGTYILSQYVKFTTPPSNSGTGQLYNLTASTGTSITNNVVLVSSDKTGYAVVTTIITTFKNTFIPAAAGTGITGLASAVLGASNISLERVA